MSGPAVGRRWRRTRRPDLQTHRPSVCSVCGAAAGPAGHYCEACGSPLRPPPFVRTASAWPRRAFVALVTVGLALSGLHAVRAVILTPERAISGYFAALAQRDARKALSYLEWARPSETVPDEPVSTDPGHDTPFCVVQADGAARCNDGTDAEKPAAVAARPALTPLASGYVPPRAVSVRQVEPVPPERTGRVADPEAWRKATVSYRVGDKEYSGEMYLHRQLRNRVDVVGRWRIVDPLPLIRVTLDPLVPLRINGVPLPQGASSTRVYAFPGRHSVGIIDHPRWTADEVPVTVDLTTPGNVDLSLVDKAYRATNRLGQIRWTDVVPLVCPYAAEGYPLLTERVVAADVTGDGLAESVVVSVCDQSAGVNPRDVRVYDGASDPARPRQLGHLVTVRDPAFVRAILAVTVEGDAVRIIGEASSPPTVLCTCHLRFRQRFVWSNGAFSAESREWERL